MVNIFVGMNLIGCRKRTDSSSLKCVDLRIHTHGQYFNLFIHWHLEWLFSRYTKSRNFSAP